MTRINCPKCTHEMDEGRVVLGYISNRQKGAVRRPTQNTVARACPNCGYMELYLDPEELKRQLS
jgi:predicted nucleic-acid-binding Zn-ribbon protein